MHLSLRLLRKAQGLNINIIIYPSHCTHLLQGLDVVCFAQLKFNWGKEIRKFEKENHRGVTTRDFAKVFGTAYLKTFTPELASPAVVGEDWGLPIQRPGDPRRKARLKRDVHDQTHLLRCPLYPGLEGDGSIFIFQTSTP